MAKSKNLVNKMKKLLKAITKFKGSRTKDKMDLRDEVLADSPKAYKYLRGVQRRLDGNFGQQTLPSPEKLKKEFLAVADITETDFVAAVAASASLATSTPIILSSVATGAARNGETFDLEVAVAAANPTDTVLADFTGTSAAIVLTITPNDGTNNGAVPVDLTTAEVAELISTGAVVGKTVTVTDLGSLRALQTASGGDATVVVDSGEGDGVLGTFSSGANAVSANLKVELASGLVRASGAKAGDYVKILEGTLVGKSYLVTVVNYSTDTITLQYSNSALSGTESSKAIKVQISGVS